MGPHEMKTALSFLGEMVRYLQGDRAGEDLQVSLWIQYTCMQTAPHLWEVGRKRSCDLVLWVLSAVLDTQRKFRSTTCTVHHSGSGLLTKTPHWGSALATLIASPSSGSVPRFPSLLQWSQPLGCLPQNTCMAPSHLATGAWSLLRHPFLVLHKRKHRYPWKSWFIAKYCREIGKGSTRDPQGNVVSLPSRLVKPPPRRISYRAFVLQ